MHTTAVTLDLVAFFTLVGALGAQELFAVAASHRDSFALKDFVGTIFTCTIPREPNDITMQGLACVCKRNKVGDLAELGDKLKDLG